jgi:hypothetical protein
MAIAIRKTLKILHTLATCGIIGGLAAYMLLLTVAPQGTPAAYADVRETIAAISNWILLPSLAVVLVSGLFAMAAHGPYTEKRWVWLKAASGILMFKGVLTIVGAKADHAAVLARDVAAGTASPEALQNALTYEWPTLWIMMILSVANVVLGVWRPKLAGSAERRTAKARAKPVAVAATAEEDARPAEKTAA